MKKVAVFMLSLLLYGCYSTNPKVWHFPNLDITVISVPTDDLKDGYCNRADKYDDGAPVRWNDGRRVVGCWDPKERTIFVIWDRPEVLLHELCHADGFYKPEQCGKYFNWNER